MFLAFYFIKAASNVGPVNFVHCCTNPRLFDKTSILKAEGKKRGLILSTEAEFELIDEETFQKLA